MISVAVTEASQVAEARSKASAAATALGLDEVDAGRAALVATELASNLTKHGGGGELLIGSYEDNTGAGLELIALDRGRGILNLQSCLQDGFSSSGTAGHGLGAIRRQSQVMEVTSWASKGTAVLSRISRDRRSHSAGSLRPPWSCVSIAKPGEEVCGDGWAAVDTPAGRTLFVVDGLGHGAGAAAAATEAVHLFQRHASRPIRTSSTTFTPDCGPPAAPQWRSRESKENARASSMAASAISPAQSSPTDRCGA